MIQASIGVNLRTDCLSQQLALYRRVDTFFCVHALILFCLIPCNKKGALRAPFYVMRQQVSVFPGYQLPVFAPAELMMRSPSGTCRPCAVAVSLTQLAIALLKGALHVVAAIL